MKLFGSRTSSVSKPAPGAQGDGAAGDLVPPAGESLAEMAFLDHLEELRWSLIKGIGGVVVAVIVCSFFGDWIVDELLLAPKKPDFFMYKLLGVEPHAFALQNRTITGQFFAWIGTVAAAGVVIGSPIFIYQMWKFIEPGLYPNEKHGMRFAALFATAFFMLGIAFGYCVITPLALQFFAGFVLSPEISNEFDITKYFSMVTFWSLGIGILFEMPVVIYFLSKLGLVTPEMLRRSRKYTLIGVLIVAAFLTPPDPFSQILVAIPLLLLYEGSIFLSGVVMRKRERELRKALQ
jgi:sec-independent protein translocase protein TatC